MAYRSLKKWFAPWSTIGYLDAVYWYKEFYLKTPEQREQEGKERRQKAEESYNRLLDIMDSVNRGTHGALARAIELYRF